MSQVLCGELHIFAQIPISLRSVFDASTASDNLWCQN